MDEKKWAVYVEEVAANHRAYAGYFSWSTDRAIEEIGVVHALHESLSHNGRNFFHSYRSRGIGNDPPDCEATLDAGGRIGIEVTELVDGESIAASRADQVLKWKFEPFAKDALIKLLDQRIQKKDNSTVKGGPYEEYVLVIYCDDPRVMDCDLINFVSTYSFSRTNLLDKVYLLFSFSPRTACCPYIELRLNAA